MEELMKLKEKLCKELEEYAKKDLSAGSLEVVDKLSHTIKNLDKIIEEYDEGGSYNMGSYARGGNRGGSYGNYNGNYEGSYARGRGRYAKRDSMGRYSSERGYSRDDEMVAELRELMMDAPDDQTKRDLDKIIRRLEMM